MILLTCVAFCCSGSGEQLEVETADPATALRDGCMAAADGGQGASLKGELGAAAAIPLP